MNCEVFLLPLRLDHTIRHRIHYSFENGGMPSIVCHVLIENAVRDTIMLKQLSIIGRLQVGHIGSRCFFQVELGFDEVGVGQYVNHLRLVKKDLRPLFLVGARRNHQQGRYQKPNVPFHHGVNFRPPTRT